jgi:hypothetical protein
MFLFAVASREGDRVRRFVGSGMVRREDERHPVMSSLRKLTATALAALTVLSFVPTVGITTADAQMRRPPPMGGGGPPPPPPRRGHGGGGGNAAAAGVFGLMAGAIIGSAIQQQHQQQAAQDAYEDAIDDCAARYRSYNPRTQTYRGYDGRTYSCP